MYCPWCGARNDPGARSCFVCKKSIPSLDADRAGTPRTAPPRRPEKRDVFGSPGDRAFALAFDRLLIIALLAPLASYLADGWAPPPGQELALLQTSVLAGLVLFVVAFLYHAILEGTAGVTLGKAIMGLQVRNEGDRPKIVASAIRNALRVLDGLLLYAVGFFVALFNPRRRRIGDMVGETAVVSQELAPFARGALLVVWLAFVVAALWLASELCPGCTEAISSSSLLASAR